MNLLKVAKTVGKHTAVPGMLNASQGADVIQSILSTEAGTKLAQAGATMVAPEFSAVTKPLISKLHEDAKELDADGKPLSEESRGMMEAAKNKILAFADEAQQKKKEQQKTADAPASRMLA